MSQAYHEMAAASVFDRMRNQAGAMNSLASQLRDRFAKVRTVSLALLAAGVVLFGLGLALSSPPNDFAQGFLEKVLRPVLAYQDLELSRSNIVVEPSLPVRESLRWGFLIIALATASIALGLRRLTRLQLWLILAAGFLAAAFLSTLLLKILSEGNLRQSPNGDTYAVDKPINRQIPWDTSQRTCSPDASLSDFDRANCKRRSFENATGQPDKAQYVLAQESYILSSRAAPDEVFTGGPIDFCIPSMHDGEIHCNRPVPADFANREGAYNPHATGAALARMTGRWSHPGFSARARLRAMIARAHAVDPELDLPVAEAMAAWRWQEWITRLSRPIFLTLGLVFLLFGAAGLRSVRGRQRRLIDLEALASRREPELEPPPRRGPDDAVAAPFKEKAAALSTAGLWTKKPLPLVHWFVRRRPERRTDNLPQPTIDQLQTLQRKGRNLLAWAGTLLRLTGLAIAAALAFHTPSFPGLDLVFPANEPLVYFPQELASWMNAVISQSSLQIDGPTQMASDGIFYTVYWQPRELLTAAIVLSLALAGWQLAVLLRKRWPMKWPLHLVLILVCSALSAVCFASPLVSLLPRLPINEPAMMPAEQVWSFPRRNDDEAAFTSLDGTGLSQRAGTAREKGTPGANRLEPSSVEGGTPAERQFCLGSTPHRFDRGGLHMRYEPRTARADADGARQRCDLYIEPDALPQVEADQAHYVLAQKAYYSGDIRQLHAQLGAMTGVWAPTQLRHRLALAYLRSEVGLPDGKASLADLARQIQPRGRRASEMLTTVSAAILLSLSCACAIIGLLRQRKARGVIMILGPVSKPPAQTGGAIS